MLRPVGSGHKNRCAANPNIPTAAGIPRVTAPVEEVNETVASMPRLRETQSAESAVRRYHLSTLAPTDASVLGPFWSRLFDAEVNEAHCSLTPRSASRSCAAP